MMLCNKGSLLEYVWKFTKGINEDVLSCHDAIKLVTLKQCSFTDKGIP